MRDKRIDNIKGILILLVVFGHLIEFCGNAGVFGNKTYIIIYAFHMPAFFLLMGMVAKPNIKKVIQSILIYLVFQTAYLSASAVISRKPISLQYIRPYWLLWFTLVEIYYSLLLIIIEHFNMNKKCLLFVSIAVSFVVGYIPWVGYDFSLARAFTFLPYYIAGQLFKSGVIRLKKHYTVTTLAVISSMFLLIQNFLTAEMMYGSGSYALAGYNPLTKALLYVIAMLYILFMYMYVPNKEIPILNVSVKLGVSITNEMHSL